MVPKKRLSIVVMLFLLLAAHPTLAAEAIINVLTGGGSSAYYPLGTALGNAIGKSMPGVKTSVQTTKGSVENLNRRSESCAESQQSIRATSRSLHGPTAASRCLQI